MKQFDGSNVACANIGDRLHQKTIFNMPLDINHIQPQHGTMHACLWENTHTGLPLSLFYTLEIPLQPFDTGHEYVDQPASTSIMIEWINFSPLGSSKNISNWKYLLGNEYVISYETQTGEGSIYLGTEHCPFNSSIRFFSLEENTFELELTLAVDFNIETKNLPENGLFKLKTKVDYNGLLLYNNSVLPSLKITNEPMNVIAGFIDASVYETSLVPYDNGYVLWQQLRPKP